MAERINIAERVLVEMDLSGIISESRDVAQALNNFADDLEKIEKKYSMKQENEESLCDSCANKNGCWSLYQYGDARNLCTHYKVKEEE